MKWAIFLLLIVNIFSYIRCDGVSEDTPEVSQEVDTIFNEIDEQKFSQCREKTHKSTYQTEVSQMMKIIVNNLYRNKEVFLRELISNSFDALDKVRFASLRNKTILDANPDFDIRIKIDPVNRIISITDTGIGMTGDELTKNLGTIAKSGTKDFIKKLTTEGSTTSDLSSQIGQFGVGFYSVFLVSDKVFVATKSVEDNKQYIFEADTSSFIVYEDPRGDTHKRGTTVILYLNQESSEFLDEKRLANLIKKYSEFIQFPIFLYSKQDDDGKEVPYHWKRVNDVAPIWMRPPSNITEDEYESFFNSIAYDRKKEKYGKPNGVIHFSAEGETNFRSLLFIPNKLEEGYVNDPMKWKPKLKLYVRRVFITGETRSFLPHYLSYVVGIIDSEDLPLNVGREMLQHNELVKVIRKKLVRKILDFIKKMSQESTTEYEKFYKDFGNAIKFGIIDDEANSNRIARLLRFYSSASLEKMTSFEEYVSRMKPGQPGLFFITANSIAEAQASPYMEKISKKGYEILYLLDNIDEAIMQNLRVYDNKAIYNVAKEGADIPQSKSEEQLLKDKEAEFGPLLTWLKKSYYKGRVASVKLSTRLLTSSCILIASEQGYSGNMDRIIRYQAYLHGKDDNVDGVLNQPKNLELNPLHPLVKYMLTIFNENPDSSDLKENAEVCLSMGTLSSGYPITDALQLSGLIEKLYLKSQNIPHENIAEQINKELGVDKDEEDEDKSPSSVEDDQPSKQDDVESNQDSLVNEEL